MSLRFGLLLGVTAVALVAPTFAQGPARPQPAPTAVQVNPPLLPQGFAGWNSSGDTATDAGEPAFAPASARKAALEESGPQRSAVQVYTDAAGRKLRVEAVEFKDASGALAAFSILSQPGMHELKSLGTRAEEGDGGVLLIEGASVAAVFPATAADVPALKALANVLPKPTGSQALQPVLPSLLPGRGLVPASVRYALGAQDYMAEGGVLPAAGLGWNQSLETVTGKYSDRRGAETLTLLLYPTPNIAGMHQRLIEQQLPGLGKSFTTAKTRREGSLVIVADGSFSPDATQALVENTHLRQILSTDKAMPTPEVIETRKTFGLLANVILFSGLLGAAAVLLAIFLGGGRALYRILRGKPPATELEFLSLHLDPQNPAPLFSSTNTEEGA